MASETDEMVTPPALARQWGVASGKIIRLIHSHQLRAVNLAVDPLGKPRWRIPKGEVARFLAERMLQPAVRRPRKNRVAASTQREYF